MGSSGISSWLVKSPGTLRHADRSFHLFSPRPTPPARITTTGLPERLVLASLRFGGRAFIKLFVYSCSMPYPNKIWGGSNQRSEFRGRATVQIHARRCAVGPPRKDRRRLLFDPPKRCAGRVKKSLQLLELVTARPPSWGSISFENSESLAFLIS